MNRLLTFTLFLISSNCFALNWAECKKSIHEHPYNYFWTYGLTTSVMGFSQYVSSWGECSALGSLEEQRKVYFSFNEEKILNDISRGKGEALNGLLVLSECPKDQEERVGSLLQENLDVIFDAPSAKGRFSRIFKVMQEVCILPKTSHRS